uniref:Ferric reductase NAD binding domain-containing protein n=1 Tax=Globodera rostochiensis TaxID=31243 RepID=A0A914HQ24_GLORO
MWVGRFGVEENRIATKYLSKCQESVVTLRTTVLYICEKHFRGDNSGISMFTGLRATNDFGRPNCDSFFKFLQQSRHPEVPEIGVFSCGPAQVNKQIRRACTEANRSRNAPSFVHRFETF